MKNYTIQNIIFGLRKEYLSFQEQVNELRNCVDCYNNFDLYVTKNNDKDKLDLVCSFNTEELRDNSDRYKTIAGIVYEGETEKIYENTTIRIPNKDIFIEKMNELDETEFAQEMPMCEPQNIKSDDGTIKNLIIWSNLIEYRESSPSLSLKKSIFYSPYEDKIYFETSEWLKKADEKLIESILKQEVPEYIFRRYHKEIMDRYDNKKVIVSNTKKDNKCTAYDIKENEKTLSLIR
jgi:hypothetical protein